MNPFQRARDEARALRETLAPGKASKPIKAKELLGAVEGKLELAIHSVPATYPDLGNGSAVLQREQKSIYVCDENQEWGDKYCGLVAHELGHWILDANKAPTTVAYLKTLFGRDGSPAVMQVEAYGARERQELQANVFARELLLPRDVSKLLSAKGDGPAKVAKDLGIPLEFVRQQTLDALYLPTGEASVSTLKPASADQEKAAKATGRAANVVAGPGTGKTSTLIHRVKYLVEERKVDPSHILVLTFTNKAAFELVERLRSAGIERAADIWAGTFHAFGLEFLRKFHQYFGLKPDFNVADRLTAMTSMVSALPQFDLKYYLRIEDPYDWLSPVITGIKRLKEELVTPAQYRQRISKLPPPTDELKRRREDVATLYKGYEKVLSERGTVDFVDLISKPAVAIKSDRALFAEVADKFQYILVDEYQDVTQAMVELLRQMGQKAKSIWVVGDVRQAIHHWRGASLKSLQRFDTEFKAHARETKIQRFPLDTNRRSHTEILDLVREVGRRHMLEKDFPLDEMTAQKGRCKELPTVVTCAKREQLTGAVVDGVLALRARGVAFGDQAVLCRNGSEVQQTAEALAAHNVPVIYIGELAQRPEIKRLLCLMQLLVERQPRALIGLMGAPGLGMPIRDVNKLLEAANSSISYQRGRWIRDPPDGLSKEALAVIGNLAKLLEGRTHSSNPWAFICDLLLEHRFDQVDQADDSVAAWVHRIAVWQFAYSVRNGDGEMKEARLSRFMLRQRLRQRIGEAYVDRELPSEAGGLDGVRVQTVHGAKGLEYVAVHVGHVTANSFGPEASSWQSPESILEIVPPEVLGSSAKEYAFEEAVERNNLLYVAVSRAKRHLRLYQDDDFGGADLTPQLLYDRSKYREVPYAESATKKAAPTPVRAFDAPSPVPFEHFDTYAICALQYWYARVVGLKSESDLDPALRARLAIMKALRAIASGTAGDAASHFLTAWQEHNLPLEEDDPSLWRDAQFAFQHGITLVRKHLKGGAKFAQPATTVADLRIRLPWGFLVQSTGSAQFTVIRFSQRRSSDIATLLRPMMSGLPYSGSKAVNLNFVLSDSASVVQPTNRQETTKAYKAAVRMLKGDNNPTKGRHCGRCPYLTICPSAPSLKA